MLPHLAPTRTAARTAELKRVSRRAMSAPSAGSARVHQVEQAAVITAAFADCVPAAF